MQRVLLCLLVVATMIAVLTGCGGNSSPVSMNLRQVKPGDSFSYQMPSDNDPDLIFRMNFAAYDGGMLENTESENWWDFLVYDDDGNLLVHGEDWDGVPGEVHYIIPNPLIPGAIVGQGDHDVNTPLSGPVTVNVPAGSFSAYKYTVDEVTFWVAPSLGTFVKIDELYEGTHYIFELTAYDLAD